MNLVPLYEEAIQFNNFNGTVLAAGKVEVWYLGRTRKADIYADVAGETPLPNPFDLNDLGMQEVYVNPAFNYTLVVYDPYGAELFSVDKYLQGASGHTTSNVVVQPSEHIGVSAWTVGEVQIYQPYLVGEVGKIYEGIEPIVVNNDVNRISANHVPLGVQDPLYFVQDDEEGCIIGCSAQTEIPAELSGKWDEASDVVIANSAQWAEGTEYEAGNYISIDNNTLSVTGLTPVPSDTASTGLVAQVSADIVSQIPSTAGLATTAQLDEKLDKSDSGKFYPMESNPSGYINELPSDLATTGFIAGVSADITAMIPTGDYLTKESADTLYQPIGQYQSALDFGYVGSEISSINGSGIYSQGGTANPQIPVTGINGIKISESGDKVVFEVSGDYYPGNNPSGFITGVDLSDYATTAQVAEKQDSLIFGYKDTAISSIDESAIYDNSAHARITTLAGRISDLSSNKLDVTAFSDVSSTFLTAVDLTPYVPASAIGTQLYDGVPVVSSISGFKIHASEAAKATYAANGYESQYAYTAYEANKAKKDSNGNVISSYYQPKLNFSGINGTINAINGSALAGGEIPAGTMNESAFGYDANDKISGYNGSAFAGGSDVPEGVMVESGLEYNAVNEISAYNGSAIAQYGHEAQWLVHDDTLVHAANSAQYALGVNLSAVAQLLGVDETVLYSNLTGRPSSPGQSFDLSESPLNFEYIGIYLNGSSPTGTSNVANGYEKVPYEQLYQTNTLEFIKAFAGGVMSNPSDSVHEMGCGYSGVSGTTWTKWYGYAKNVSNNIAAFDNNSHLNIWKVVGIGRKQ